MAVTIVNVSINAAEFPFIYAHAARSMLDLQDVAPRMPGYFHGGQQSTEFGISQLLFCENALPTAKGLMSVSYGVQAAAHTPAGVTFDQAILLRDSTEDQYLFSPAGGNNMVYDTATSTWTSVDPFVFNQKLVTRAYVNGRTFVCYERTKIVEYNATAGTLVTVALTLPPGVTVGDIRGIANASNYLLFFTDISVYWCSPLNILDFDTIDQGAGSQIPTDIRGLITCILPVSGGCIIYTARNAVGATFTNNAAAPFVFKEINNCGGVTNWEHVTTESEELGHWIWGTHGLQFVTLAGSKADSEHAQLTDFLVSGLIETWDFATKKVITVTTGSPAAVKLSYVAGRYLVVSYGAVTGIYTHALIFDTSLKRWGKLVVPHADVFMYPYPLATSAYMYSELPGFYTDLGELTYADLDAVTAVATPAKKGIAFLGDDGSIVILAADYLQLSGVGVAIFGRIQATRQRYVTVHSVEVEGMRHNGSSVHLLPADEDEGMLRGAFVEMYDSYRNGTYGRYSSRVTSLNFDIVLRGSFILSGLFVGVSNHGSR